MRQFLVSAFIGALMTAGAARAGAQPLSVTLPEGHEFTNPGRHVFAISPDGRAIVYSAKATLFVKRGDADPVIVSGPLRGRAVLSPSFSPDGGSILYWAQDRTVLQRVPVGGGPPVTIAKVTTPFGMSWGADNLIVVGQGADGIVRVSASGGVPRRLSRWRMARSRMDHRCCPAMILCCSLCATHPRQAGTRRESSFSP